MAWVNPAAWATAASIPITAYMAYKHGQKVRQRGRNRRGRYRRAMTPKYAKFQRGKHRTGGYYARYNTGKGMQEELKFLDSTHLIVDMSTTWATSLSQNLIPQGNTESQRNGRTANVRRVTSKVHVFLTAPLVASNTHDVVHVKLMLDTQCNGSNPLNSDIVEDVNDDQTFRNLANTRRFKTLWSRTVNLHAPAAEGNGTTRTWGEMGFDFVITKNLTLPIHFDSTTGAITEIQSNNLFYLFVCRHDLAGMDIHTRIRFVG